MPTKTTDDGRSYTVTGKTFEWTTDDGATVTLPLRIKLKVIRAMDADSLDAAGMFAILDGIAPGHADVFDEMDLNDFSRMFVTFQREYQALSGASLGE